MVRIAKIAVSAATYAIDRPFDYLVPGPLEEAIQPGMRAAVPFGRGNRVSDGIVLALGEREDAEKLKSILALLDEGPLLDGAAVQLALWMREQYFCTVYDALRVMIPAGLWFSLKSCWRFAPKVDREAAYEAAGESKRAQKLVELLFANGGWAEEGKIRTAFGVSDPGPAIRDMEERGIIVREASAARGIIRVLPPWRWIPAARWRCLRPSGGGLLCNMPRGRLSALRGRPPPKSCAISPARP